MSLTVVGATMLAAICCKQLREEAIATSESNPLNAAEKILKKSRIIRAPDLATSLAQDGNKDGLEFVQELAKLSEEAIRTSIWCTVRPSTRVSLFFCQFKSYIVLALLPVTSVRNVRAKLR